MKDVTAVWKSEEKPKCINGTLNGYGRIRLYKQYQFGEIFNFIGAFKNGKLTGQARLNKRDGSYIVCLFIDGIMYGKGEMYLPKKGFTYYGHLINGILHGEGAKVTTKGNLFEVGFYVNGSLYTGKKIDADGFITYYDKGKISSGAPKIRVYPKETVLNKQVTEYYDKDGNLTTKENAYKYKIITYESQYKPKGIIKRFYMDDRPINSYYALYHDPHDLKKNFKEGTYINYDENGKVQDKVEFKDNQLIKE
ncbi:hypothetical protein [Corallibacter sp.]|uniref:hypothetical protein n=1 Tax=Corallibacter sp. TaxID=2038084 RepID=UPI003AB76699